MSLEEIEVLRGRAEKFLKNGEDSFKKGVYDLAAFNVQLYLKYKLFVLSLENAYITSMHYAELIKEVLREN